MAWFSIHTSEREARSPVSVHVLEANGSSMSGAQQDGASTAASAHLNGTAALGLRDQEINTALFEVKVFNIVLISLALCVLTFTGLYCITVCYNRTRQSKRAHVYESAVTRDEPVNPVAVKAVKRSASFMNPLALFRKPDAAKDNSRIYYIYSNPLPIGVEEEEEAEKEAEKETTGAPRAPEEQTALSLPLSFQEYAKDPASGVILDPPIFYMQL